MPSPRKQYERLLRDAGCSQKVIAHCHAVTDCALELAGNNSLIDRDLLEAGAMLHDIGRGRTHSIQHAQDGADICRSLLIAEPVARIVERHTGAGLTADECTLLHLLPRDCIPLSIEERIVAHADNLMEGTRKGSIERSLGSAIHLKRRIRRRLYHLALDVECSCKR
jgi:uncharacterized protein